MVAAKRKVPARKNVSAKAKTAPTTKKAAPKANSSVNQASPQSAGAVDGLAKGLRIRMFRVGFGDFFLVSVPDGQGEFSHILIDCGVHAQDLKSIRNAVQQMAEDCGHHLALVVMTHRHADHISGFASCSDIFSQIEVDRVWMPWFDDPSNKAASAFQSNLTAMAARLSVSLAARGDAESAELANMVDNITGGMNAAGGSNNQKALDVLRKGFKNAATAHDYYKAGDPPTLPDSLEKAGLTVQVLGPPIDRSLVNQMTNKSQQYLANEADTESGTLKIFSDAFHADESEYPQEAFRLFPSKEIIKLIDGAQPDVLAAQALAADKTLNNQSLVLLFSFAGKNLLFAGDAQWGNWENFLYGGAYGTPGHTKLTDQATKILESVDFYKVGHHGSANATPKDAVAVMRLGCVGMCSTQIHAYNEVPREPLLDALRTRMKGQLARSDQVAVSASVPANSQAGPLPSSFKDPTGKLFIDYEF